MLDRGVSITLDLYIFLFFYENKIIVKPSCVLCLSQKSVSGTSTFLWETPHVFPHEGIRLAPRFPFSYPTLYTATGASKPTNLVALDRCLIYCFVRRKNGGRQRNKPNQSRRWNSGHFGPFQISSIRLDGPEDPYLRNSRFRRSRDHAHASIPPAQTPWGLTGRAWLQAGAQRVVIVVSHH